MADLRRLGRNEQGVTLVELLVVTVLMGIISGIILTTVVAVQRVTTTTEQRLITIDEARVAANNVERQLRNAVRTSATDPILNIATDQQVWFLGLVAGQDEPDLEVIYVDNDSREVTHYRQRADAGTGPNWTFDDNRNPRRRVLLAQIDVASPMFAYYDLDSCVDGDPEHPDCDPLPFTNGRLSDDRLNRVDMVEVRITAEGGNRIEQPLVLTSRVLLRNSAYRPGT